MYVFRNTFHLVSILYLVSFVIFFVQVTWSPSVVERMPKQQQQCGGFFQDESTSDPFPASGFKPCPDSPPPGMNSSPLKCTTIRPGLSKPEKRDDYIPE